MLRFKELRKSRKLTQIDLSKALAVSQTTVSQWETERSLPDYPQLIRVADFYDVTIDYLLGRSDVPGRDKAKPTPPPEPAVSAFDRQLLAAFHALTEPEQVLVCRSMGLTHPAARRVEANRA